MSSLIFLRVVVHSDEPIYIGSVNNAAEQIAQQHLYPTCYHSGKRTMSRMQSKNMQHSTPMLQREH